MFPALPPARYLLGARLEGFLTHEAEVAVSVGWTARHDVLMRLGTFTRAMGPWVMSLASKTRQALDQSAVSVTKVTR